MIKYLIATWVALAIPAAFVGQTVNDDYLTSIEMQGMIGPYRVGLNYTVRNNTELVTAHYFYASQLKNIQLTGVVQGEEVDFKGADGSVFHLHFIGNGSNGTAPLTFYNSVGLAGAWKLGSQTLPAKLTGEYGIANPGQRQYDSVTSRSDAEFEAMVQTARRAILRGDANLAARFVHFPLTVNTNHGRLVLRNPVQLKASWSRVFTLQIEAKLQEDIPHEMFVHEGEAMLGQGELWFDDKGLTVVNEE